MNIWMAVTADELELPIAVADTAEKLGELFGINRCTVVNYASKNFTGKIKGRKFVKVEVDDYDDEVPFVT